jgi:hypothetical protein
MGDGRLELELIGLFIIVRRFPGAAPGLNEPRGREGAE